METSAHISRAKNPAAERAYEARLLRDMPGCAVVLGPGGTIVYANEAAQKAMGIGPFVGRPFADYFMESANEANDEFYEVFLAAVRDKRNRFQGRCPFVAPNGRKFTFFVTSSQLKYGEESYLVITCADVTAEEEAERLRRESVFVLMACIAYICAFIFIYAVWNYIGRPGEPKYLTRILEVGGIILGIIVYRRTSLSFSDLGLSTKNLAHNLKVDGLACLGIIAFFCLLKLIMMNAAPQVIAHPEAFYDPAWVPIGNIIFYVFTALIQEFLTRGIMQESLMHILTGPHRNAIAIVMSTIMFASLHLMYSPLFMLGAAVMLGVFGIVYLKQRSIWGLALIHFTFGITASMLGLV